MDFKILKSKSRIGLVFTKDSMPDASLVGYGDSYFAGELNKRKSTAGYMFLL